MQICQKIATSAATHANERSVIDCDWRAQDPRTVGWERPSACFAQGIVESSETSACADTKHVEGDTTRHRKSDDKGKGKCKNIKCGDATSTAN